MWVSRLAPWSTERTALDLIVVEMVNMHSYLAFGTSKCLGDTLGSGVGGYSKMSCFQEGPRGMRRVHRANSYPEKLKFNLKSFHSKGFFFSCTSRSVGGVRGGRNDFTTF